MQYLRNFSKNFLTKKQANSRKLGDGDTTLPQSDKFISVEREDLEFLKSRVERYKTAVHTADNILKLDRRDIRKFSTYDPSLDYTCTFCSSPETCYHYKEADSHDIFMCKQCYYDLSSKDIPIDVEYASFLLEKDAFKKNLSCNTNEPIFEERSYVEEEEEEKEKEKEEEEWGLLENPAWKNKGRKLKGPFHSVYRPLDLER